MTPEQIRNSWDDDEAPARQEPRPESTPCDIDGCSSPRKARGLCAIHYSRARNSGNLHQFPLLDPGELSPKRRTHEERVQAKSGYVILYRVGAPAIGEHRFVMEKILGRPLEKGENVHHINGVRNDNRPENLELWYTCQPKGQRVEQTIQYVVDFHREALTAALSARPATHSPEWAENGSPATGHAAGAREARYAEAIGVALSTTWSLVADAELAGLRAEVERLTAANEQLREDKIEFARWRDKWVADMQILETKLAREEDHAEAAEDALAVNSDALRSLRERIEALADEWQADYPGPGASWHGTPDEWWRELRAALAAAPAVSSGEAGTGEAWDVTRANAWDEGYIAGADDARRPGRMAYPDDYAPNPYRAAPASSAEAGTGEAGDEPCLCGTGFTCMGREHTENGAR